MIWINQVFLGILLLAAPQNPASTTIEGQVFRENSPEPVAIAYARVELQKSPSESLYARTDANGRFRIPDVPVGQYRLIVMAAGFVAAEYGQRAAGQPGSPITVTPASRVDPFVFKLVPASTITGHVKDSDGNAMANVPVQLLRASYAADGRRVTTTVTFTRTDDRGEYRLYWLTPGEYYVSASPSMGRNGPAFIPQNQNLAPRKGYPALLYPGVPDLLHALPLALMPGETRAGIDFRFMPTPTVSVSGRVIDKKTGTGVSAEIYLGSSGEVRGGVLTTLSDPSGKFMFKDVTPGAYTLGASSESLQTSRNLSIDVPDMGISDLEVALEQGFAVRGRVMPDPDDAGLVLPKLSVGLIPGRSAETQTDGSFEIKDVRSCSCTVYVSGLTGDLFIKSVRFGGSNAMTDLLPASGEIRPAMSVSGSLIPMTPGQITISGETRETLDVIISSASGRVRGSVINAAGVPQAGARVVLVPEDKYRGVRPYYQLTTSDQNGGFSLKGIPPGSYILFGWDTVENGAYYNREFMRPFEGRGVPVQIEPRMEPVVRVPLFESGK